ncbi:winged helix-turn-helix domain-containing protein [Ruegeria hyattellae]|uniref:winged helix-turn-helix domain-containing protein n=1 Tax=Ruegeria hyattellae TaxID=3233337 RepID=UPI00355B0D09
MSGWYFSESDDRLICPEQIVQLTPKAAAVLSCLRKYKDEIVSTKTFLEEVWPGLHVTPDLVREYIHDLRAALKDDAKQPKYIETVRGKGFRLINEIDVAPADLVAHPPRQQENRPTVAVLKPEANDDKDMSDIADAIASDIINHLARFHYVGVVARQSTFSSNEVTDIRAFAQDVQADYILESNFARFAHVIRARIQLVDARTGNSLWGERLDLQGDDPLAVVDEVVNTVVLALTGWHGELHRAEFKSVTRKRESKLNAFEHFVLGCDLEMRLDAENLQRSLYHLEQSVRLDPTFARAWLVYALELRWAFAIIPGRDRRYLERANTAFETAFNLAPTDPVNLALMSMNTARIGNLDSALVMLERAEATMAGDSDAMVCTATAKSVLTDDVERASSILDKVLKANTAPPSWFYFAEAGIAFMAGQYERCVSSSLSGPQEISALVFRCLSYAMLGQSDEAIAAHNDLMSTFPMTNFERFADNFPIVSKAQRRDYDGAVKRLGEVLAKAKSKAPDAETEHLGPVLQRPHQRD